MPPLDLSMDAFSLEGSPALPRSRYGPGWKFDTTTQPTDPFAREKPRIEPSIAPSVPNTPSRFSRSLGSDFSQCWRNALKRVTGESRTSGVPERSTFRMILDTPAAEIIMPTAKAMIPRIRRLLGAFATAGFDPKIEKETIAKIGGNADAKGFLQDCTDEIEAIVRNRKGKENTSTMKNPSTQSIGCETNIPATTPRGNATMSKNHDRISIPKSLRKFRTFSPRRIIAEFSASPISVGITTPINGKSRIPRRAPANGKARTDASTVIVRKTERTSGVDGKPTLRMKLNAPTVPPTPPVAS